MRKLIWIAIFVLTFSLGLAGCATRTNEEGKTGSTAKMTDSELKDKIKAKFDGTIRQSDLQLDSCERLLFEADRFGGDQVFADAHIRQAKRAALVASGLGRFRSRDVDDADRGSRAGLGGARAWGRRVLVARGPATGGQQRQQRERKRDPAHRPRVRGHRQTRVSGR